jgi:hypothetical protein
MYLALKISGGYYPNEDPKHHCSRLLDLGVRCGDGSLTTRSCNWSSRRDLKFIRVPHESAQPSQESATITQRSLWNCERHSAVGKRLFSSVDVRNTSCHLEYSLRTARAFEGIQSQRV